MTLRAAAPCTWWLQSEGQVFSCELEHRKRWTPQGIPETGKHLPSMSKLHHALRHICFLRLSFPFRFIWVESSKERTQLNLKTRNDLTRLRSDCCQTQMRGMQGEPYESKSQSKATNLSMPKGVCRCCGGQTWCLTSVSAGLGMCLGISIQ